MRVLFLTDGTKHTQSAIHRARYFSEYLTDLGHDSTVFYGIEGTLLARRFNRAKLGSIVKCLLDLNKTDVLVIHRAADPLSGLLQTLASASGVAVLFDMDDGVYLVKNALTSAARYLIKSSSAVTAASHAIAEFCLDQNSNVHLVPGQVDTHIFRVPNGRKSGGPPVIGWMGDGRVHGDNLKLVAGPLRDLASRLPFKLKLVSALGNSEIIGAFKPLEQNVQVDYGSPEWVDITAIPKQMEDFDVSIMPLRDTPFNRAKAGQKLLESMAMGIPVIASPVGENRYIVRDGEEGYLASSENEWRDCLELLIRDPELRLRMGAAGREKVERGHSREICGRLFSDAILSAVKRARLGGRVSRIA